MPNALPTDAEFKYSGADNLEIMLDAVRYNAFLADEVLSHSNGARCALDIGSGTGTFAQMVRSRGLEVTCLEPDNRLRCELERQGFACFADLAQIPAQTFDYVFSLNVFEHIEDDAQAAREALRILKPGGALYVYLPAFGVLFGAMDRKVGHQRRYRRETLAKLFGNAGFEVKQTRYVDVLGFFATLAFNLLPSDGTIGRTSIKLYGRIAFPLSRVVDQLTSRVLGKNVSVIARSCDSF